MKGRKPKPTALKLLTGNPGHRARADLGRGEPDPEVMLGEPPATIAADPIASAYWYQQGGHLLKTRVITIADHSALALLCEYESRRLRQKELLVRLEKKRRPTVADVARLQHAANLILKYEDRQCRIGLEFGMTPASRTRVKIDTGQLDLALPPGSTEPKSPLEKALAAARSA